MQQTGYINYFGSRAAMPPRYFGNVAYYLTVTAHAGDAFMRSDKLFDKRQKSVHRCDIAGRNGIEQLTVPVSKPHGIPKATWADVAVSSHGNWWHVHLETLKTAYGRSPFFEFYIDKFLPFFTADVVEKYPSIVQLDSAIDAKIREILLLPAAIEAPTDAFACEYLSDFKAESNISNTSASAGIVSKISPTDVNFPALIEPYWQLSAVNHGFLSNLSILDLIFNLGPSAPLYLASCLQKLPQ